MSVLVGVSLGLDGDGVEDAGCDGAPSEAEEESPRVGTAASSVEEDAESGDAVLLDRPATIPAGVTGQGVAELAAARPSRTLRSTVSPSVPSSAVT